MEKYSSLGGDDERDEDPFHSENSFGKIETATVERDENIQQPSFQMPKNFQWELPSESDVYIAKLGIVANHRLNSS